MIRGTFDRRILVNYRVDPGILARSLPAPFRPKLVRGVGMAGICLIRLKHIRPRLLPEFVGGTKENTKGRIQQYFPQVTDFRNRSHDAVRRVRETLNHRRRACLTMAM